MAHLWPKLSFIHITKKSYVTDLGGQRWHVLLVRAVDEYSQCFLDGHLSKTNIQLKLALPWTFPTSYAWPFTKYLVSLFWTTIHSRSFYSVGWQLFVNKGCLLLRNSFIRLLSMRVGGCPDCLLLNSLISPATTKLCESCVIVELLHHWGELNISDARLNH